MSDNTFWVNTDGLTPATARFHEKANQLGTLASQISDLMGQIPRAAGGDALGRQFSDQVTPQIGQLQAGVQSLADTLGQTGDSVGSMAKMFNVTDDNASSTGSSLSNLLNTDPGSGGGGSGSGSGGGGSDSGSGGGGSGSDTALPRTVMQPVAGNPDSVPGTALPEVVRPRVSETGSPGGNSDSGSGSAGGGQG